jgi:hypothetical protein
VEKEEKKLTKKEKIDRMGNNSFSTEELRNIGRKRIEEIKERKRIISMVSELPEPNSYSAYKKIFEIKISEELMKECTSIIASQLGIKLENKNIPNTFYLVIDEFSNYKDRLTLSPLTMFFSKEESKINMKEVATTKIIYALQEYILMGLNEEELKQFNEVDLVSKEEEIHDSIYASLFLRNKTSFEVIKDSEKDPYEVFEFINEHMIDDFSVFEGRIEDEIEKIASGKHLGDNSILKKMIEQDIRKIR